MIIVHGMIPLDPDQRDEALRLVRWMADKSQVEDGCISYEFYVGLSDPNKLMLFQEWEDHDALMEHFQTAHMEEFLKALPEVVDGEILTRRYAVEVEDDDAGDSIEFEMPESADAGNGKQDPIIH